MHVTRKAGTVCLGLLLTGGPSSGVTLAADGDPAAGKRNTITCNGCHGQSSMKSVPLLGGQNAAYLVDAMRAYRDGLRTHSTMRDVAKGFTDREYRNFAAWYAQPGPERPAPVPAAAPALVAGCASCHGEDGYQTVSTDIPRIAGQRAAFIMTALREYRDGQRQHPVMTAQARALSDDDITGLASYYSSGAGVFLR